MEKDYIFRQAKADEVEKVFSLIMGRVSWMDQVGIHQWNDTKYDERYPLSYYEMRRQKEELFVLEENGELLCVGALFHEDERWPDRSNAYYLHHFASGVAHKGMGTVFLDEAEKYTKAQGKTYLRLDSAIGNKTLERYYESRGYTEAGRCVDGLYKGILRQKKP